MISDVAALACQIWREHYPPIIGPEQTEYMLRKFQSREAISRQIENEGYLYFLLKDKNGEPAGYAAAVPAPEGLFLSKLYVESGRRGKGCGKLVLTFIESLALAQGLSKINLTVNKHNADSVKFYEKSGFVIADSLVTDIGSGFFMDDYLMEKSLAGSGS